MIILHHLEKSQSIRILWLLEELDVPYDVKLYDRDPVTRLAPAAYKAISPLGTAPVITDGDITMAETNAIVDYILDRYDEALEQFESGLAIDRATRGEHNRSVAVALDDIAMTGQYSEETIV